MVRHGGLGRGARRRGGDLTDRAGVLRPAVEAALAVARQGLAVDPVVPPPQALRRYLGFSRLSGGALQAIARIVEADSDFRARVAAAVDPDTVGRAGWLWLQRPDGWEDELAAIAAEAAGRADERRQARAERSAVKKLAAAQAAAAQAAAGVEERRREVEGLRADLARERELRSELEARVAGYASEIARLEEARTEVVRNLKEVEARLVSRSTEFNATRARLRQVEEQLRATGSGPAPEPPAGRTADRAAGRRDRPPAPGGPDGWLPPRDDLVREVDRAAAGAASLADALGGLARMIGEARPRVPEPDDRRWGVDDGSGDDPAADDAGAETGRRVPLRLPGGIFDDSVEAVVHLLRTPAVVLVVDGYNVSMTGWPPLAVADQRRRLVAALAEAAARTATEVHVVFDGADIDPLPVPRSAARLVHVRFSPPGVEADDVVLDLTAQLPAARPVVVASSDNRVRDGARRLGANVVSARQLLDLLGR